MNKSEALEACPWCKGKLELGILQGDRFGVSWFDEDSSSFNRFWSFTGEKMGRVFTAQRCRACEKVILLNKKK
jgi:hypothetical protein